MLCVDNYFTGRKDNIAHLLDHPHFEVMRHDVTFPLYVEVDEIYNLACPASPVHYQFDPVQTTKTSVIGAINMLGLAKRLGARILQASTSEVYGDPDRPSADRGLPRQRQPAGARAPAMTRANAAPRRCSSTITASTGSAIKVARIFNTYGPRMHPNDGRVVSNFIVQALRGEDITLYGDGSQTRAFCYVDDLIDGLIRLMAHRARRDRPDQHRQPTRNPGARTGRTGDRADRVPLRHRPPAAAAGRSDAALPRHHPGAVHPQLDPRDRSRHWVGPHGGVFPDDAGRVR